MTDKYRVHEIVKFNYSDIGEYIDENHTDRPLRNDILVELLNKLHEENKKLKEKIDMLKNMNNSYEYELTDLRKQLGEFEESIDIRALVVENQQLKMKAEELNDENKELKEENEKLIEMVQGYQKWSEKRSKFL